MLTESNAFGEDKTMITKTQPLTKAEWDARFTEMPPEKKRIVQKLLDEGLGWQEITLPIDAKETAPKLFSESVNVWRWDLILLDDDSWELVELEDEYLLNTEE